MTPQTPFLEQRTQTEGRAVNDRKAFGRIQSNKEVPVVLVEEISDQRNFFVEKSGFRTRDDQEFGILRDTLLNTEVNVRNHKVAVFQQSPELGVAFLRIDVRGTAFPVTASEIGNSFDTGFSATSKLLSL